MTVRARDNRKTIVARPVVPMRRAARAVPPTPPAMVDVDAIFADTMTRFPETMKRLAE